MADADTVHLTGVGSCTITAHQAGNGNYNAATNVPQSFNILDGEAPVIASHTDVPAEATSAAGAVVNYTSPTASDNVDANVTVSCLPASGSTFVIGSTDVACNAQDSAGNNATTTHFNVIVSDTTAPVIAAHTDITAEATSGAGAAVTYTSPATSDAVDGAGVATCLPASSSTFAFGDTTVNCNATDTAGNPATATSFKVTVKDTTIPVITRLGVSPVTVEVGNPYSDSGATASDNIDGNITGSINTTNPVNTSVIATYTVRYNVTDAHGNPAAEVTRTVNVVDHPAPVITSETASGATTTSITITWDTDHLATSRVIYDTVPHAVLGAPANYGYAFSTLETDTSTKVLHHSVTVTGLTPGTTYYLRAVSHGSPESVSSQITQATNALPKGSLKVTKTANGGNAIFPMTLTPGSILQNVTTVGGTGFTTYTNLTPGSYSVTENLAGLPGWQQNSNTCNSVNVVSGQEATCVITNTYTAPTGSLLVRKNTVGGNDTFNFTGNAGSFSITTSNGTGTNNRTGLTPGSYSVTETAQSGWQKTGDTCQNVTVVAGQQATCTITNTKVVAGKGKIKVIKKTNYGNGTFNFTGDLGNFSITTNEGSGDKTFSDLPAGNSYNVNETAPAGWVLNSNTCQNVVVVANQTVACIVTNSKVTPPNGKIKGVKFEDRDGDGSHTDDVDHRLSGWTIYVDTNNNGQLDGTEQSTITNGNGEYELNGLIAGTYTVREVMKTGWIQTVPGTGSYSVTLYPQQMTIYRNFGNFKLGSISGQKYEDKNGNGSKNNGENGIQGWSINLYKNNVLISTATTDANGNYTFANLGPGTYRVREVQRSGWTQKSVNPNDIKLRSGAAATGNDFGNKKN